MLLVNQDPYLLWAQKHYDTRLYLFFRDAGCQGFLRGATSAC